VPVATAVRSISGLSPTSTLLARPAWSRCDSFMTPAACADPHQYGSQELRVHVALRDIARIHHQRNRFNQLVGVSTALCLVAQAIGQRVEHISEASACLKWHLTKCEH